MEISTYYLFEYPDEDKSLHQLLELLSSRDQKFIESVYDSENIDRCTDKEIRYLTLASALIDYYLQLNGFDVPDWLRAETLSFKKPYYHSKRISDFEEVKLMYSSPAPFTARNVHFDLDGIKRV